jgi:ferric-dicitrate binding protein FerR (iron transport regulator)
MTTTAVEAAQDTAATTQKKPRNRWAAPALAAVMGAGAAAAVAWWIATALELSMGMGAGL